jgi:hypothetical protein
MASVSNQYTFIFHSGGSSRVGPQMVLGVLKTTSTRMTLKQTDGGPRYCGL